jgi:5-methylthioadenosine/S-adenosylhomocysteine deaminase
MSEAEAHVDTLIHARWIAPVVPDQTLLENHSLAIDKHRILDILPTETAARKYSGSHEYQLDEHIVIPGLINSHGHASMTLLRGYADDLQLMTWLNDHIWPVEAKFVSFEFVRDGTQLAIAEMLRSGTTFFSDLYFFPDAVAQVATEMGMRVQICVPIVEFANVWAQSEDEHIHKGLMVHDDFRSSDLVHSCFGPHSPYAVSDKGMNRIMVLSEELDVPIQMHVHETQDEIAESLSLHGKKPLQRLHELGLLSPRFQAVHLTQLDEADMQLLRDNSVQAIHCPESNLKLASGFCPVGRLMEAGINVALGTDGAASNNDLDMFGEMKTAALLAKAVAGDATTLDAWTTLKMATLDGAKALGLEDELGSLEPGKLADIAAIRMGEIESQPIYHPLSQLVYTRTGHKVSHVWVNGEILLNDRQFTRLDQDRVIATTRSWQTKIMQQ